MAFGSLAIITVIILIAALAGLLAVALKNGELVRNNTIFTLVAIVAVLIAAIVFTASPSNFIIEKCIAAVWVILAVAARIVKGMDNFKLARLLLSISIIGATVHYLFF